MGTGKTNNGQKDSGSWYDLETKIHKFMGTADEPDPATPPINRLNPKRTKTAEDEFNHHYGIDKDKENSDDY